MTPNEQFLLNMRDAAKDAGHVFPEYAACEAALETALTVRGQAPQSNFGKNATFLKANNVFGEKQIRKPVYGTVTVLTWEERSGHRFDTTADFIKFPEVAEAFKFRMDTLNANPSIYGDALAAKTGEEFVIQVSAQWEAAKDADDTPDSVAHPVYEFPYGLYRFVHGRWSTGTARAKTVLAIYDQYKGLLAVPEPTPALTGEQKPEIADDAS